jgi:acyl-CoA synthetase (AMP-forming)/AMP-acid ligase II/thioesterase domain-containing protein
VTLYSLLEAHARQMFNAIAITAPERKPLTYGSLFTHISCIAKILKTMGLGRNDRIAISLPNGPEMAVTFLAVTSCATSAPLNPSYLSNEFNFYLTDLNAKALILQSGIDSPARGVAQALGVPIIELSPVLEAEAGIFTLTSRDNMHIDTGNLALPEAEEVALILHTSGTTSRPKIVPLTQTNICTSANNIRAALKLVSEDRCMNVMPLFHIHGLIGALLSSLVAGGSVICTPGFVKTKFFEWMNELRPTWYTAVPTMHQAILDYADDNSKVIANCPLRFIRSSSSSLPPQIMTDLERVFNVPIIESYGMTEASHQMTSNPLPPRERKIGSVGVTAGPEVAIMDEAGNLLASGDIGEIVIRGANVMKGYENNPMANNSAFINGWFRTGDQGTIDEDDYLFITGRLKEIINRGGEKISPREVDELLLNHPAIVQAVTFASPHATLGEDVCAAVVLRNDNCTTEREIREFATKRLAYFKVPRRVLIVDEIPKGPTGKLQRIGLAKKLGLTKPDQPQTKIQSEKVEIAAPRTVLEKSLADIWSQVLGVKQVSLYDNFFDLGGDSMLAGQLFAQIRKTFGKSLTLGTILLASTIKELATILKSEECPLPWTSLLPIQTNGTKPPFYCIHGHDGQVFSYRVLANLLGPDQPFYGLQAQGLDGEHPRHTNVKEMATHYIKEIQTLQPEGPYFIGGVCSGGSIAFEMAHQLREQGQEVSLLSLIDAYAPHYEKSILLNNPIRSRLYNYAIRIDRLLDTLILLKSKKKSQYILESVKREGKMIWYHFGRWFKKITLRIDPKGLNSLLREEEQEQEELYKNVSYDSPKVYPGRVTLFRSKKTHIYHSEQTWGWDKLAGGGIEINIIPGYYQRSLSEPYIQILAEKLRVCLENAQTLALEKQDFEIS